MPADTGAEHGRLAMRRRKLTTELEALRAGAGPYADTDLGKTARHLTAARADLARSEADLRNAGLLGSRRARTNLAQRRAALDTAAERWRALGAPVERRLTTAIEEIDATVSALSSRSLDQRFWELEHPQVLRRLDAVNREILTLEHQAGLVPAAPHRPATAVPGLGR
jgi:hypothetical protein